MMSIQGSHLAGQRSNVSKLDDYPTPAYCTEALMKRECFEGKIWECACGSGAMLDIIRKYHPNCFGTDILTGNDFLLERRKVDNIVTNPPYKLALAFAQQGLRLARHKLALFLRLNFLEGQRRYHFFKSSPLQTVYVFSRRQTLSSTQVTSGGTIAYAWFVWERGYAGKPYLDWINDESKED